MIEDEPGSLEIAEEGKNLRIGVAVFLLTRTRKIPMIRTQSGGP